MLPENDFYKEVLMLKESVEEATELGTMHAARLKLIRLSMKKDSIALLKRNRALKNVVLKLSGESLDMPTADFDSIDVGDFINTFKQETLDHFNSILLVAHTAA